MAYVIDAIKENPELFNEIVKIFNENTDKFEQFILQAHEMYFDTQMAAVDEFAMKNGLEIKPAAKEKLRAYMKSEHIRKIKDELAARREEERNTARKLFAEGAWNF